MLPTRHANALTPTSLSDYLTLAAREPALPPTLAGFLALLGPGAKDRLEARHAALCASIRHLQAGAPEAPSIQLWLLVSYTPSLQAMATRLRPPGASLAEAESAAVWAFLETLLGLKEERLAGAFLIREIERDTQRRLQVSLGLRDYQQEHRIVSASTEADPEDRLPNDPTDAYQTLDVLIQDLPVSTAERALLVGLYVYNYSLKELAAQSGEAYKTVQQRHLRLMKRLREKR